MTTKRDRVMRRLLTLRPRETKKMKRQRMKVRTWLPEHRFLISDLVTLRA